MSDSSGIEWTDATWNPVAGCTPVSPGCLNCYAAVMARRLEGMGVAEYAAQTEIVMVKAPGMKAIREPRTVRIAEVRGGPGDQRAVFTGEVRTIEKALTRPLHWKKPRRVFVNSMSDLFHEKVTFEFIDRVFAVMALCPQHTFQVLTKRPERMAEYFHSFELETPVDGSWGMMRLGCAAGKLLDGDWVWNEGKRHRVAIEHFISDAHEEDDEEAGYEAKEVPWPLPNVWLGTSVENQAAADERIPHLLRCPAAVRFLSCEPLLEAVDLGSVVNGAEKYDVLGGTRQNAFVDAEPKHHARINWVIVGGESGAGARICTTDWIRGVVNQCRAATVPVFVKQVGSRCQLTENHTQRDLVEVMMETRHRKGGDPAEWPEDLRVREMPEETHREIKASRDQGGKR